MQKLCQMAKRAKFVKKTEILNGYFENIYKFVYKLLQKCITKKAPAEPGLSSL